MNKYDSSTNFFYELGMLRRVQREGWKLIGINQPESIAEHSLRAAQIAYVLAQLERHPNPEKICSILVFHDIGESRIGDIQKVANRYVRVNERNAVYEQLKDLGSIGKKIIEMWDEIEEPKSSTGIIAKDADLLDLALTACEYKQNGFDGAEDWLQKTKERLRTDSAKQLFETFTQTNPNNWWNGLKHLEKKHVED